MLKKIVCIVGAGLGGITLSQAPEYTQQYSQRLAGAVDELSAIVAQFDQDAASFGLSREEGLERYVANSDSFLVERGTSMRDIMDRHDRLSAQLAELRAAPPATRLFEVARYFDTDVGAAALDDFRPALPLTIEGLVYIVAGLAAGFGLFWALATLTAAPFRQRRPRVRISRVEPRR